ncbi:MAG: hypothetical protein ACI808_000362 [Paraglaciecola sp.]|jgi:hypothetical protein
MTELSNPQLLTALRALLQHSRSTLQKSVNSAMVLTYWQVGQLIVEDEQQGESRAAYGNPVFPIRNAVRTELSWTHYRKLIRA